MDIFRKTWRILAKRERRRFLWLFLLILASGIVETAGIASIMPFLAVLSNPEIVSENIYLSFLYERFNFADSHSFLCFIGAGVFSVVVISLCLRTLTQYALARFTFMRNHSLSAKLLKNYLSMPYVWFLNRHSADLGKTVLSEVQQVINQVLMPAAELVANLVITLCLIILLIVIDPWVAFLASALLGGGYALIYFAFRKYLSRIGEDRVKANQERFTIAQEVLGGIKEVKAAGLENGYINSFRGPSHRFAKGMAANKVMSEIPKFLLQALAFGGILVIILVLLTANNGALDRIIPTLGVFALAGKRLLPALQKVYSSATKIRFGKPALDLFYNDYMEARKGPGPKPGNPDLSTERRGLRESLDFVDVAFTYPGAPHPALTNLSFRIEANTTVGFVGSTGAGKTTAVDLILGLLTPCRGEIRIDGKPLSDDKIRSWQRSLGYVPQQIFLADDTVAANIAFGLPGNEIDMKAVENAAWVAELHTFVTGELSNGYETLVGDRGIRLSGGQRQRIGIARALYHDPDVLVMDEATAALDNVTEKSVMQAVHSLSRKKTIILIAHRLSTVKDCDCIYLLEHGRLTAQGTYQQLIENSHEFQKMAAVND